MNNVRYLVFREGKTWYAVALELHIVESGSEPQEALFELFEAVTGYLKAITKNKKAPTLPPPDKEYETMWKQIATPRRTVKSPYHVYTFGARPVTF